MGNGKQGGEAEERLSRDLKRPREDWRGWRGKPDVQDGGTTTG